MASVAFASAPETSKPGLLARIGLSIFKTMEAMMNANPRVKALQTLAAMSDEELAERGLKREDIARHVFRGVYFV